MEKVDWVLFAAAAARCSVRGVFPACGGTTGGSLFGVSSIDGSLKSVDRTNRQLWSFREWHMERLCCEDVLSF
jgi:hypothetical protein